MLSQPWLNAARPCTRLVSRMPLLSTQVDCSTQYYMASLLTKRVSRAEHPGGLARLYGVVDTSAYASDTQLQLNYHRSSVHRVLIALT